VTPDRGRGERGDRPERVRGRGQQRVTRPPQRVRVTSPRMGATARPPWRPAIREIDEQTGVGEVYLNSLMRTQLRIGLSAVAVLALSIGAIPFLFALIPRLGTVRVLTVPLTWVLIMCTYPTMLAAAWWYVRSAERAEQDFAEIIDSR